MTETKEIASKTAQEMQQSIDSEVSKMATQAKAVEAQLVLEPEKARQRLDERKQKVDQAGQRIVEQIEQEGERAGQVVDPLRASLENMQVQLALAWAEGRDAYEKQKKEIESGITKFVAEIDRAATSADADAQAMLDKLKSGFIDAVNALDAELAAAELQYVEDKEKVKAEWERQKQAVDEQIARFKSEIEERGKHASEKLEAFEGELSEGLSQLKKAFSNLVS